ncbi:hypothetical protein [Tenacibaculum sp. SG-28]|uniref:hypothetical protein n=1 Tax=Tenacibaculum sp. SG-28 TaxID=754426 RepID=UPI000CF55E21|nr:hypothetical protein [Tenacibaculum sp. SG-28]PQJ19614.1 hypothetical protein BSU00_12495 [Tenacibaculum sp. SG-28]
MKKFIYALPEFMQPKQDEYGIVLHVSENGKIISSLCDTTGEVIPEAGAVKENNGVLYIGGDILPYIGRYVVE